LKDINKILIVIQRSNGDVFLSSSLVEALKKHYKSSQIDLLVNDDTYSIAKLIPHVKNIYTFSYQKKKENWWKQEKSLIGKIFKKYDLSINLTSSDRSVIYALMAGKRAISAIEKNYKKSWWKSLLLSHHYYFDDHKHILLNNLEPLNLLEIEHDKIQKSILVSDQILSTVKAKLKKRSIKKFIIFHPSTQYKYKIYPKLLRDELLSLLSSMDLSIVVTGTKNAIDSEIKKNLPVLNNVFDFIGETSIEEYFALSELSDAYIGMDTLNMHIAASQNQRIFAIFGPTKLAMWSPWSNKLSSSAQINIPIQTYDNITIFQANMPCVACGNAGCNNKNGNSDCLDNINPNTIFKEISNWHNAMENEVIPLLTNKSERKFVLYIIYGEDESYYQGALFSFLTFKYWLSDENQVEFIVLTEKPEKFTSYPIKTLLLTSEQKNEWSLNGAYHFRIKNRGMAFVMDELNLNEFDKILFLDADTYINCSPLPLFDLIQPYQALFYLNEGLIYGRKRFYTYVENLEGKKIEIEGDFYELSENSSMWGSLMVGLTSNMRPTLDWADKLLVKFFDLVPSHTIEPFALSESLLKNYKIAEGKDLVSLYSTSRKKEYANKVLSNFFNINKDLDLERQIYLAQKVKIKRPLFTILKQRLQRVFSD
jgi:heptosyltransferase III